MPPVAAPDPNSELRILIVRTSAIGDVLMTSPVAQALREQYPRAYIAWVVEPLSAPFVRANPYVDEVIVFEQKSAIKKAWKEFRFLSIAREMRAFARQLAAYKFDIALDFQGLLKSGLIAKASGATRRLGYTGNKEFNGCFMTEKITITRRHTHLCDYYLELLTLLGIPLTPRRPILHLPEEHHAAAREFLASRGLGTDRYAVCCLTSSRPQKDWVWSRWSELADALWEQMGLRTVYVGGPERRVDAMELVENSTAKPISAVGYTSLVESAALVQDAALVIGVDTGLTYAGLASDRPTVALYGSTDSSWMAEEPHTAVCFHPMPCSPCMRRPTCQGYPCMQAITVQEVIDTAKVLIEQQRVEA
jgi:heptosyltransferase-1